MGSRARGNLPVGRTRLSAFVLCLLSFIAVGDNARLLFAAQAEDDPATLFRKGQYEECVESATKALGTGGFFESIWVVKLRAQLELGRYADALTTLDAALEKLPNSIQVRFLGRDICRFVGQAERATKLEAEIATLLKESGWRYTDAANQIVVGRMMLAQNADPKTVLKSVFNELAKRQPNFLDVRLAMGELALAKQDYQLAAEAFQQAAKLAADSPDAWWGTAQAFAPSDSEKASAALSQALTLNPRHLPSLLMLVDHQVDSEQYDAALETLAKATAVNPHHPRALAYHAVVAHLRNKPEAEAKHRAAALRHDARNPEVDHLIGRKLSQKYRFAEGEKYQRQSLTLDPNYLPSKMQLAQDLLRLGREEEGLKLAEEVYAADAYSVQAHNLVTLQEQLAKFRTLERDGLLVRMEAREADVYGERVVALLQRARTELAAKYDVKLEGPIIIEMFPRQADFAIRTFGMPGGAGFLGVCFGTVITATSPAAQGAKPACWEATLWHEFCHAVTLHKTNNRMPRWLSEGISVYEERLADKAWGQSLTPKYREMILGDDLTPVSELSGAFLRPKSALHLQFAYFESSLVVEYLVEKYGHDMLMRVLTDLGVGMPINESLARYVGSTEKLDEEFAVYARGKAKEFAPQAEWAAPELPRRPTLEAVDQWLAEHPQSVLGWRKKAELQVAAKQWNDAIATLERLYKIYPQDYADDGTLALLAKAWRETGDVARERKALELRSAGQCADLTLWERLGDLAREAGDWEMARRVADRMLAVQPLRADAHRRATEAAEKRGAPVEALTSYRALVLLDPFDPADAHFRLASVLKQAGDLAEAKRHVLLALAEAPRFAAAQKLLLELTSNSAPAPKEDAKPANKPATPATAPSSKEAQGQ